MDRRRFLGVAAATPILGSLILGGSKILEGGAPPEPGDPPKLYVPEKPVIVEATRIERPFIEGGIRVTSWNMSIERERRNMHDLSGWGYPELGPPEIRVSVEGLVTDVSMSSEVYHLIHGGVGVRSKRLRMILLAEDEPI